MNKVGDVVQYRKVGKFELACWHSSGPGPIETWTARQLTGKRPASGAPYSRITIPRKVVA